MNVDESRQLHQFMIWRTLSGFVHVEHKVDNKASSCVTMIQMFEYYYSHYLKKAFEAAFGCVT
jgi:hypothetical protein